MATPRRLTRSLLSLSLITATVASLSPALPAGADNPTEVWFPVQLPADYPDTWGDARSGGRSHEGTDIMAPQMRPVFAADDGIIKKAENEDVREGSYASSYYLLINHDDGHSSFYVHLNNDTPGRPDGCDGRGGAEAAFSPRLVRILREKGTLRGVRVQRGEHIAYVGSSGNAGCGNDHLHFELWHGHDWGASKFNPYRSLVYAVRDGRAWGPGEGAESAEKASLAVSQPEPEPTGRLAGADRLGTAVRLSRHAFAAASTVVLAPAEVPAEGLIAAPLAAVHDAPVLLANGASDVGPNVTEAVAAEIARLGATDAIVVGGPAAMSLDVERELVARAGLDPTRVRRIAGADIYELAANVAEEVLASATDDVTPVLANAWPDALAAATLAAQDEVPIILTRRHELPDPSARALAHDRVGGVRIAGGTAVIGTAVEQETAAIVTTVRRLAGDDRYGTALAIVEEALAAGATPTEAYLATGHDFPDALTAGPVVATRSRVLLLVDGLDPAGSPAVHQWLRAEADTVDAVIAVGGANAIREEVLTAAARSANWPT